MRLQNYSGRMAEALTRKLKLQRQRLNTLAQRRVMTDATGYVQERRLYLDQLQTRLDMQSRRHLERARARFVQLTASLDALSPMKVLGRGYALAQTEDGGILKDTAQLQTGQTVSVQLEHGGFRAAVTEITTQSREDIQWKNRA